MNLKNGLIKTISFLIIFCMLLTSMPVSVSSVLADETATDVQEEIIELESENDDLTVPDPSVDNAGDNGSSDDILDDSLLPPADGTSDTDTGNVDDDQKGPGSDEKGNTEDLTDDTVTDTVDGAKKGDQTDEQTDGQEDPSGEKSDVWTLRFRDRDGIIFETVSVEKGEAIGNQLPSTIEREDYNAFWAIGTYKADGQSGRWVLGDRINADYVPTSDADIVPDYSKITYTVSFYENETDEEAYAVGTVDVDTSYCLNNIPAVPMKNGYTGKWVYSGGDFTNSVTITEDTRVWAEYDQNVFTVNFLVDGEEYHSDTYYSGDTLTLPTDPVVDGKEFKGWYTNVEDEDTKYNGGEPVNSNLTLNAAFTDMYAVNFVIKNGDTQEVLSQYYRSSGDTIGTMPQDPFVAGKIFEKWVREDEPDVEVTADTVIDGNITAIAVFREVNIYNITAEYYYLNDQGEEVIFNTDLLQVETHELPYTITAPASTKTDPNEVSGAPIYYPEEPTVTVNLEDFDDDHDHTVRIKYVPYTAVYDFVYMLKDLEGDDYTEIEGSRVSDVQGVLGSYVTPNVKSFDNAVLERAEGATIKTSGKDGQSKQELYVYYTRKHFQLSYDTQGGSYVSGATVPYETVVSLPETDPVREGYTFGGWYTDVACTDGNRVTGSVTVTEDTTLYAKWTGKTVGYTIIYMKEQYESGSGDEMVTSWVYDNSDDATGTVGTEVVATNAPNLPNNRTHGYEKDTQRNAESKVTIAADGSSVLYVYYKLIRYTLVFNLNNGNGRITMNGQTYTGSNYRVEGVVLGQDISSMWPSNSNEVYSVATSGNRYFRYWTGAGNYVTKRYELIWDNVSNANANHVMTFTASWTNSSENRDAHYWLQQPDGTYIIADEYSQTGLNTTGLSAKDIDGYAKHNGNGSRPDNSYPQSGNIDVAETVWVDGYDDTWTWNGGDDYNIGDTRTRNGHTYIITEKVERSGWHPLNPYSYTAECHEEGHYETHTVQHYVYNFYYDRYKFSIRYFDGGTELKTTDLIYFDADISGSEYNYTPTKPVGKEDYIWGGWYDNSSLSGDPYVFDKMPAGTSDGAVSLVLYAKWIAPTYTVSFVDGDDTSSQLFDSQTVEKTKKATNPGTPTKTGYTFDGWFTTADGEDLFDWNTQITADTTVYANWSKNNLSYTVRYVDSEGNTVSDNKIVSNPNLTVGQTVQESAIAVAGYRPDESSKSLVLSDNNANNIITFVYTEKGETTGYTVRYIINPDEVSGDIPVAVEKVKENVDGDTASVIEMAAGVDYASLYAAHPELVGVEFYPDEVEKTFVLTANAEQNVFTFYYSSFKHANIVVHFVDMAGNAIADDDAAIMKVGKTYTLSRPPITGWELAKAVVGTTFDGSEAANEYKITETIAGNGLEFTLFYYKKATITAKSLSKQYDGLALTLSDSIEGQVTVSGLRTGDTLTAVDLTFTNADSADGHGRLNAGIATVTPNNAVISGIPEGINNYYKFRYISGTLEVTKINVTVRIEPDRWTGIIYDGEVKKTGFTNSSKGIDDYILISHAGYKAEYLDDIWEAVKGKATYDASSAGLHYYGIAKKDAGEYTYDIGLTLSDLPEDSNYSVSLYVRQGRLQILRRPVTVITGSDEKAYDGTPLTNDEAEITGLVEGETVGVEATGSQTEAGTSDNTYRITWAADGNSYTAKESNYAVEESLGTLTVNQAELIVTVKEKRTTYNGSVQEGYGFPEKITGTGEIINTDGYTIKGLGNVDVLSIGYASPSGTDAGTYDNGLFEDEYTIRNATGDDVSDCYKTVIFNKGKLVIEKAPVTVTTGSDSKAYDGTALTKDEATITGLVNGETATVTATGTQTEVGSSSNTYSIEWGTTNKDNYEVTENLGTLTVTSSSVQVVLTAASASKTYDGTALTNSTVTATGLPEGFSVEATAAGSQTDAGESANVVNNGFVIRNAAGADKTANFTNVIKVNGTLKVNKAPVTITTGSDSKAYDGTPLTKSEATITGLVNGETATVTATGTITEVGSVTNTYDLAWGTAKKDNYEITNKLGTLEITKNSSEVTLTAPSDSKTYDGTALTADGIGEKKVTASGLPAGFTVEATASGSQTNAGESANKVNDGYVIKNAAGEDKTANFTNVNKVDGTLTVNKAPVTITTGSASKVYDGTALTNDEATITGLVNGETVTVTATGSQTEVGSSSNTYTIEWGTTNKDNYTVTGNLGTLTVTSSGVQVVLTAASASKTYDGTALTNSTVTASGLPAGFTVKATASGSQTDAGESANVVNDGYVIRDAAGADKTANFTNIQKVDGKLTVNKAPVTITTGSGSKPYDGTPLTKVEASITGLVNGETATVTATGSQTEVGSSGNTYSIEWGITNKDNYEITENLGTLTVTKNSSAVTLTAESDSKTYNGKALTNAAVTASGLPEGFTVEATASGSQTDAGSSANVVNDGYVFKNAAGEDKTANFTNVKKVDGTLTVNKAPVTITTGSDSKPYDGTALTKSEASITGLVNGESAIVTATGSQIEVGSSSNTYSIDWGTTNKDNYKVTENLGTLNVIENTGNVTLTAASDSKTYDGKALTNTGVTASGLPEGFTVEATATGSQTDAGESANVVNDGFVIKNAAGEDKTANFTNVKKVDGTLTVEKAPVTITTGSDSKAYDGIALTNSEASITGLVNGESATVTATGSQTEVGSSSNTYSIEWGTTNKDNYTVTENLGTLTVTSSGVQVVLTAASASKTYDGTALTNSTVTASGLPSGFTVEATAAGSQTDAGSSANVVNDGYVIKDASGADKTANFTNVKKVDGTLTVNKAAVTITTGSDSKTYDGTALTKDEATITGLVNGETATVTATGSQTEVGSSDNTYSIDWGTAKAANYTITEALGTLEITKNSSEVTLTAPSDSKTYDGTALTADGTGEKKVTASGLPEGFTVEATATGSQTDAGESANVVNDGYVIKNADGADKTANFTNVKKVDGTLTVNKAPVMITTGSDSKAYDGTPLTKAEASITGLVNGETATVTATGSQTEVGSSDNTYSIDWGTTNKDNYRVTEKLGTLEITKNSSEVTLTAPSDNKTYDGTALTADGTGEKKVTASGLPAGFTVEATASGSQTNAGESANKVNDGYVIKDAAGADKTANFTNIQKVDGKLTVNKAPVTIMTGSGSKPYDGTPLTKVEASITGLVNGESATVTATGSQTEIGSSSNTYTVEWGTTNKDNYTVTENLGTLTVTSSGVQVVLTAASASKTYDGTALTNSTVTASGLPAGFTVEATASGSQTDAGESANVVNDGYVIKDAAGADKTANFTNIQKVDGKLTVNKAPATITTGSGSKPYDGTPLTKVEASITGLVNGESATVTATGSQTEIGSSSNTYTVDWGTTNKDNYTVTENLGTLTVTVNSSEVTLTAPSDSKTYDGTALTADGTGEKKVTASGLPEGFTVEATAAGSQTDAGSSANVVNDGYVIRNAAGEDKTANFTNVTKVDGTLTVNKAPVTITTGSESKPYDGTALTKDEATIEGLVNGETATVKANGTITEVGSVSNTYDLTWGTANRDNYKITNELGTLEITENSNAVTLTAATDSKTYDGKALTNAAVTASGLPEGFTVEAAATGSQTNAGESANIVNDGYVIKNAAEEDKTANFTNVTKVDGTLTVNKAPVTVTTGSDSKAYDGTALTNDEATITGLVNGETATVTATGSQTEVGSSDNTYSIDWGTAKAANYTITEELGTLEITVNIGEVTLTAPSDSKTYDGTALTADGSGEKKVTASGLPEGFTVEATASGFQTNAGSSANVVNDGYVIKNAAGEDKTANFTNVKKVDGTLTVEKAAVTITTGSESKSYDGTALTKAEASITGLVNGETATVTATGSQTEVGSSSNTYSIDWGAANKDNYEITENLGTLTVTKNSSAVTLTAPSDSKTYDGTALTADGTGEKKVTASGLPSGFTVEATATGSQTNAGESANKVNDGYVIKNAAGEDKTANFTTVTKVDGTLTVNKAPVTITTGSDSKAYDGTALTKAEASITGLVNGETATVTATGSQTEVGSSDNTYTIDWGTTNKDNYEVTETLGKLTVTENNAEVVLTAASDSKTYDGKALTNAAVTASGLPEGFTVEATAAGFQTDAGSSANVVNDGYVFKNAAGEDKTANFTNVTKVDGTLTVNKAAVTITTGSDSKAYDGTALTKDEASITGLVNGETAAVTATGTQTEVGSSDNNYSIDWGTTNKDNYAITENLGTLTITKNSSAVTLTAPSDSKTYDGTALTADGTGEKKVTASGLPSGFTVEATASGSQTNAGESANKVNDGYVIKNAAGEDKTANFTNVTKVDGTLTVEKAPVTITTGSASKQYDGAALTKDEASITGLVNGETAAVTATGTQTEVGSSGNTYSIDWGTAKASNYTITEELGTLEVTKNSSAVTLTAPSDSKTYDGTALTADGTGEKKVTASGLPSGFTVEATASGSQTNAGESANKVNDGYVIKNAAGEDKTANFTNVTRKDGTLTVNKKAVTLKSADLEKVYDGAALINNTTPLETEEGFVEGEGATYRFTGSQTLVGESANAFEYTLKGNTLADNYTITKIEGKLKVTDGTEPGDDPVDPELVVTKEAADAETVYHLHDTVTFNISATNIYAEAMTITLEEIDGVTLAQSVFENVAAGETVTTTAQYTITLDDVAEEGFVNTVTASMGKIAKEASAQVAAGKYAITIEAESSSKVYDGTALTNGGFKPVTGLLAGDTVSSVTVTGSQTNAGSSDNVPSGAVIMHGEVDVTDAYDITYVAGTLEVTARPITISIDNKSKTYDNNAATDPALTASVTGLPAGVSFSYTLSRTAGQNAGEYVITAATADDPNYIVTVENGSFSITPAAVTVTAVNLAKTEGDADPVLTVTVTGLVGNDTITYTITRAAGEAAGTYVITPSGAAAQGNYTVTYVPGTFTINAAPAPVVPVVPPVVPDNPPVVPDNPPVVPDNLPVVPDNPPVVPDTPEPETDETIEDETAPEGTPETTEAETEEIPDDGPPEVVPTDKTWALINLILMIATVILTIVLLVLYFAKKKDSEEDEEKGNADNSENENRKSGNKGVLRLLSLIPAVGAIVAFFLTEDMRNKMVLADKWTILMAVIAAIDVVLAIIILVTKKRNDEDERSESEGTAQ